MTFISSYIKLVTDQYLGLIFTCCCFISLLDCFVYYQATIMVLSYLSSIFNSITNTIVILSPTIVVGLIIVNHRKWGINMCYIPKRCIFTVMAFFGCLVMYSTRVSLSIAMVAMVNASKEIKLGAYNESIGCFNFRSNDTFSSKTELKGVKYNWDPKTQGVILSSFYYGYVITQLPGGILCDRFGAKWLFGSGILVTAVLYLLIPLAANWGVLAFTIIRILEGLGEGLAFPAITQAISNWSPRLERSRISSVICCGVPIGNIIGSPISGFLSSTEFFGGWPFIFYLFGSFGCAWFVLWSILVYESPEDHPSISKEELIYIQQNKDEKLQSKAPVPWKEIFSSLPVWAVIVAHFGNNYAFLMFLTLMPTYFKTILFFDIKTNGLLSAMPYAAQAISMSLASYIADKLRKCNTLSISTIRKSANSIGLIGPAVCCLGIIASGCQRELIVGLLCLGMFLNGFAFSGFNVTHVDMSADFSGVLFGITNTVANTAGILTPILVGFLTASGETVENWNTVFYITAAVYISSTISRRSVIFYTRMQTLAITVQEKYENEKPRCYIPKRFIFTFLGFFGLVNVYALRVNLSVAMVAMVNNTEENTKVVNSSVDECPYFTKDNDNLTVYQSNSLGERYDWDAKTQGVIMSSFFYAYFITVLTGGYFAKRFGAKLMFGAGIGSTSVLTLLTPIAVRWGIIPFIIVRTLEGVGEGLTYPAINTLVSQWAPKLERSRISTAVFSGASIGTVISLSFSGLLCKSEALGGWPSVFYVFGAIGCFWYALWIIFIYETPDEHPTISKEELFLIYESEEIQLPQKDFDMPWRKIFTSLPMWGVLFGHVGSYFGLAVLMTELPSYLSGVLHYSVESSGLLTGLPNLLEALGGVMASYIADKLISTKRLSVTAVRKLFQSIGMVGSGICLLAITASGCEATLIIVLYSLLLYVNGFKYSGYNVTHVDMYPPLAGILFGMTNCVASLSGIIVPNMTGAFTASGNTRKNWNKVFYVTAGVYFITTVFYDAFASAELQPWESEKKEKKQSGLSETES